jgi:translation elongation factor EF-1beta
VSTLDNAINTVDSFRDEMIAFMVELLKIKVVNPDGGGTNAIAEEFARY